MARLGPGSSSTLFSFAAPLSRLRLGAELRGRRRGSAAGDVVGTARAASTEEREVKAAATREHIVGSGRRLSGGSVFMTTSVFPTSLPSCRLSPPNDAPRYCRRLKVFGGKGCLVRRPPAAKPRYCRIKILVKTNDNVIKTLLTYLLLLAHFHHDL